MDTHIAKVVPAERLSRVYAFQRIAVVGASAIGVFAVAVLIDATSGAAVIAMAGTWMVVTGLVALLRIRPGKAGMRSVPPSQPC